MNLLSASLPHVAAAFVLVPTLAQAEIGFTPYGMDAVPGAVFYTGPWNFYGSDQVPTSRTADHGFRGAYGLDGIPDSAVPHLLRLKDALPGEHLQVLTRAIEESSRSRRSGQ